jgi:hypothetical protein
MHAQPYIAVGAASCRMGCPNPETFTVLDVVETPLLIAVFPLTWQHLSMGLQIPGARIPS